MLKIFHVVVPNDLQKPVYDVSFWCTVIPLSLEQKRGQWNIT